MYRIIRKVDIVWDVQGFQNIWYHLRCTGFSEMLISFEMYRVFRNVIIWFGLVSLFNGISTLFSLFNAKAILIEEQYYLTHSWEDKGVHTFPKGICPKVNVIARLETDSRTTIPQFIALTITPRGHPHYHLRCTGLSEKLISFVMNRVIRKVYIICDV